jgi:hypothetical protein
MSTIVRSIFIPHVFEDIPLSFVVNVLENTYNLGSVSRIESIPKKNRRDGHNYYCCFVFFDSWNEQYDTAIYLDYQMKNDNNTKMFYDEDRYWIVTSNKSELKYTVDIQPKHMSLVTYLPMDISVTEVADVMEQLDFGKIECIHFPEEGDEDDYYTLDTSLEKRKVTIHYKYWYRTRSASAFQEWMKDKNYVDVAAYDEEGQPCWTFYEAAPITNGINPYIWTK